MASRSVAKEFHNLLKNIHSLSGGQARVSDWDDEDLSRCEVEISPNGGLYKYAKFKFQFELHESDCPEITCKTPIYHPNIDTVFESSDGTNVCVSVLDEWNEDNCLDDCVQGLLFLFYNPNLEDPLCPLISPGTNEDEFEDNVKTSLEGGDVEGLPFETNYGYLENGIVNDKVNENIATSQEVIVRNNENKGTDTRHEVKIEHVNIETTHEVNIETSREVNIETSHDVNIETIEYVDFIINEDVIDKSAELQVIGSVEKENFRTTSEKYIEEADEITTNESNAENYAKNITEINLNETIVYGSRTTENALVIKPETKTQLSLTKFRQYCERLPLLTSYLSNNRIHGSNMNTTMSFNLPNIYNEFYIVDNLVPYRLLSAMCSRFIQTVWKSRL